MRFVIAGASGFLGQPLARQFTDAGHHVTRLVRRSAGAGESTWDPYAGTVDRDLVAAADVVINLAGSPTAGNPHSSRWARELEHSRVTTTTVLAEAVAAAHRSGQGPAYLAGNGISFYGDHGDELLDESAESRGDGFLTKVTRGWQAAAMPAAEAGARVVILRTAPVLDRDNAPLSQLRLAAKAGLATRIGDGHQHFPVISHRDWVAAVTHAALDERIRGPVNLCCPSTPTNGEFTKALADAVRRPAFLVAPGPIVKALAGRMGPEVLNSMHTVPQALLDTGFEFADEDVRDVLATALSS